MKPKSIKIYKNAVVARRHNKRMVIERYDNGDAYIKMDIVDGRTVPRSINTPIRNCGSSVCFRLSREGLETLLESIAVFLDQNKANS